MYGHCTHHLISEIMLQEISRPKISGSLFVLFDSRLGRQPGTFLLHRLCLRIGNAQSRKVFRRGVQGLLLWHEVIASVSRLDGHDVPVVTTSIGQVFLEDDSHSVAVPAGDEQEGRGRAAWWN